MSTTTALDMSLDDIIKANKKSNPRSRQPPRTSGPTRRFSDRANTRTTPYSKPVQASNSVRPGSIETGTKLYISNLDYGVSNEDIKELFAEVGDIKRYSVHYDRSGRSEGTAEVVFARREDAVAAVKKYNNVQLDGKPMKIEIVGTNVGAKPAVGLNANAGGFRNQNAGPRGSQGRGGGAGRSRGGGRGARRGGGRGRGRDRGEKVTAEDLDADLEKYHTQAAMEEN